LKREIVTHTHISSIKVLLSVQLSANLVSISWVMTSCCGGLVCLRFGEFGCPRLQEKVTKQRPGAHIYSFGTKGRRGSCV